VRRATEGTVAAAGIVLAGGRSRRFGGDKLAAALPDGRPLLRHAVQAVAAACATVVVVLGPDTPDPDWMPDGVRIAHDAEPFGGPLAGLVAGLEAIDDEIAVVVGGDMPSLSPAVLRLLATTLAGTDPAASARLQTTEPETAHDSGHGPTTADRPPPGNASTPADGPTPADRSPAILPCAVRRAPALEAARSALSLGDRRLRALFEGLSVVFVPEGSWRSLDPEAASLADVDRPSDLPVQPPAASGPAGSSPGDR
jgi:molybdopterin-guanine dinucleotide biosynthesis protein A